MPHHLKLIVEHGWSTAKVIFSADACELKITLDIKTGSFWVKKNMASQKTPKIKF